MCNVRALRAKAEDLAHGFCEPVLPLRLLGGTTTLEAVSVGLISANRSRCGVVSGCAAGSNHNNHGRTGLVSRLVVQELHDRT
jgi:hypothetical protein